MLYKAPRITVSEHKVIQDIAAVRDKLKNRISVPKRWLGLLRRNALARAIQGSNSIEGYTVNDEDAIAAAEGEELLEAGREARLAVVGYRNALTFVLQLATDPHFSYNEGFIRSFHFMMLHPVMIRAAMSHLNLILIHPFSDGNGRMARCLQTLVLAREGILEPQFSSIEEYLGENTPAYYAVLAATAKGIWSPANDTRSWIRFCLTAHYRQGQTLLRRTNEINRLWDELEALVRRMSLPERMIFALADAAMGLKVRNATYRVAAGISDNLASRDLKTLIDERLLVPDGEARGRVYRAADVLKKIRARTREPERMVDPVY